jgi:hypothetical protein
VTVCTRDAVLRLLRLCGQRMDGWMDGVLASYLRRRAQRSALQANASGGAAAPLAGKES